jgi:transposase
VRICIEAISLDSISVKMHPDGTRALKKRTPDYWQIPWRMDHQDSYGCGRCQGRNNIRTLSKQAHDAPEGRELLRDLGSFPGMPVIMDRAYEGNETRQLLLALDMVPVIPPKSNRVDPWRYDRALYKKCNEIERLFRRLKGFRRIVSCFEKWDCVFLAFVSFALIVEALR